MRSLEEILKNQKLKILKKHIEGKDLRISANFTDPVSRKVYYVIFTSSLGWEHASVSQRNKTPEWEIMCRVKDVFWSGEECCIEYHPKEEDYINMHEHCLHIWKPIGIELPMPPSIMVGIKGIDSKQAQQISKFLVSHLTPEERLKAAGFKLNRKMRRK